MNRLTISSSAAFRLIGLVFCLVVWTATGQSQTWQSIDINCAPGTTTIVGNVFTIAGYGNGTSGTTDSFRFVYRLLSGDCEIVARLTSQTETHEWARAGVMIRQNLNPGSPFVQMGRNPEVSRGVEFQHRRSANGATESNSGGELNTLPRWLRLRRIGNTFSGFQAPDVGGRPGRWAQQGANVTVAMTEPVRVGLAVSSHSTTTLSTAVFDNVSTPVPNPFERTLEAVSQTAGDDWALFIQGNLAYIGNEPVWEIRDITNPTSPVLIYSDTFRGSWVEDIWVSGNLVYIAHAEVGFFIFDATIPTAPILLSSRDTPGVAVEVHVSSGVAYVADYPFPPGTEALGLAIFDVTDPTSPTLIETYPVPGGCMGVTVVGNLAYVTDEAYGLIILNVTDPTSPTRVGAINPPGMHGTALVRGTLVYMGGYADGLHIIDVSNPSLPTLVSTYDTPGLAAQRDGDVSGELLYYLPDTSSLQVLDVSNPVAPTLIAYISLPGQVVRARVVGDLLFVPSWLSGSTGFWIFRWTGAEAPRTGSPRWSLYR